MRLPRPSRIILIAFAVILPASPARAGPLYNTTALTAPGQNQPVVEGLSNNGQILFDNPWAPAGSPISYLYSEQSGGSITPLGMNAGSSQATPYTPEYLSGNGQILGWIGSQPVLSSGGSFTDLPGWGQAVNDSGHVAYESGQQSYIYSNGVSTNLGTVPGYETTAVSGINNSGQAAATGYHYLTGGSTFLSQPLFYNGQTLIPLGTFGGPTGFAAGINNNGDVIGVAFTATGAAEGFVSHNGGPLISLGTLPGSSFSSPSSINDSGQIVGSAGQDAFLYQNGVLTNLNTLLSSSASNINLTQAIAINNAGQIVARGFLNGENMAQDQLFLLTPQGQPVPASPDPLIQSVQGVPEPSTLAIFGLMLAGTIALRWRRPVVPITASASR